MAQQPLLLPNLSGLKLKDEEEDTGSVKGERPNLELGKRGRDYEGWYDQALFGPKALQAVATSIENNEVLTSYKKHSPMYETLPGGMAFHTVNWWFAWQKFALDGKTAIGSGSHNSAYLVPHGPDLPLDMLHGADGYRLPLERVARGLIVRIGKKKKKYDPPDKAFHINEMITAAYAYAHDIGPVIFAQFYIGSEALLRSTDQNATEGVAWDADVGPFATPDPGSVDLADLAHFTCTITEAWDGDCVKKISSNPTHLATIAQFDPEVFANKFVELCARAADAGFWHMDIKRANLLYRTALWSKDPNAIELTFTDFDSHFCRILAPALRPYTRHCCIAATVACFLGEIRCQDGYDTWARFAGFIRQAMKDLVDPVDIEFISPGEWCFFLRSVGESREVTTRDGTIYKMKDEGSAQQRELGDRFRNHMNNYFYETPAAKKNPFLNDRCFKLDPSLPLFPQVVTYALGPLP